MISWNELLELLPIIQKMTEEGWIFYIEKETLFAKEKFYPERGSWYFDTFTEFKEWLENHN